MPSMVQAVLGADEGAVVLAEPEIHTRPFTTHGDSANDWLCAWCLNRVASDKDRFTWSGATEFLFKNPQGISFHIITFSQAIGCRQTGVPTSDHTWFPGYAWSYCLCDRCRTHLGWFYAGASAFVGLIRDRILRASPVMN